MPPDARKSLVENHEKLSLSKQTGLLEINRTGIYKRPAKGISDDIIQLMHKIDRIHTDEPTWGYRTITSHLWNAYAIVVNRKRVRRLMREMGIYAIYPKPNLSKRYHAQYVRPYLLRNMEIVRPDQVWGVDITYIPVGRSFIYLFVIIDWYSRYIVDWELSATLDKGFVLNCMRRALDKCRPEIVNSDQGGHFTNPDYIALLEQSGVRISMDGKGQCLDNARTERFFRTLKYDRVYINEYASPREIRQMLIAYIPAYNNVRPHTSADGLPPASRYKKHEARVA